jgi:Phosphotransferase enzyme family
LIIEDLAELKTVDKWIESTEGLCSARLSSIATELGSFLADFHLSTAYPPCASLRQKFKNEDAMDVVLSAAVEPVLGILQDYDIPDAQALYDYVVSEFNDARQDTQSHILCMGDLWTGSILVGESTIGVIDWEFATMGTPSQDAGQLGSFSDPL